MVLVPVCRRAHLIRADERIDMLGPYDLFEAIRGRQNPDQAA
jgi:hypothetical protein